MRGRAANRGAGSTDAHVAVSGHPESVLRQGSFAYEAKSSRLPTAGHARKWLRIDNKGQLSFVQADKHTLSTELSVPTRDLRILDPMVANSYPTAILIREKALVVHLENIRMIICKDQVLMISVPMPLQPTQAVFPSPESPFVQDLVLRITQMPALTQEGYPAQGDGCLPFELVALEMALTTSGRALEGETAEVERVTLPTLERLGHKVSKRDLEDVKNHKSTLNRLLVRVTKTKQVIEAILQDDNDMQDMYLGRRAELDAQLSAQQVMEDAEDSSKPEDIQHRTSQISQAPTYQSLPEEGNRALARGLSMREPMQTFKEPSLSPFLEEQDHLLGSHPMGTSTQPQEAAERGVPASGFTSLMEEGSGPPEAEELERLPPMRATIDDVPTFMRTTSIAAARRASEGGSSSVRGPPRRSLSRTSTQYFKTRIGVLQHGMVHTGSGARLTAPDHFQRTSQLGPEVGLDEMQTIVWTRNLNEVDPRDIEGCEDMLEGFLNEADTTLSRLNVLKERIDATEALISIQLDSRRNDIVSFDLVMTMATTCMAFTSMTASIFGQNVYFNASTFTLGAFMAATLPSVAVSVAALVILLTMAKRRQLVFT